jgi:hypothetical protein
MITSTLIHLLVLFFRVSHELDNGLGRTPQMGKTSDNISDNSHIHSIKGWNSWNHFGCNVDEKLIKQVADTFVASGLAAAGYEYGLFAADVSFESCFSTYFLFSEYGRLLATDSRYKWYYSR